METTINLQKKAEKTWQTLRGNQGCIILTSMGHYCGYIIFPKRPLLEQEYDGIATWVPVHGDITFARPVEGGFAYGFDCAHVDDDKDPQLRDLNWLKDEVESMEIGIIEAAKYEERYLLAESNDEKLRIIQEMTDIIDKVAPHPHIPIGFNKQIAVLGGNL